MNAGRLGGSWVGAAGLLLIVFVSGALVGAAGMRVFDKTVQPDRVEDLVRRSGPDRGGRPPGALGGRFMQALGERLDLNDEQSDAVRTILERRQEMAEEVFESIGPRMRASIDSMEAEIRAVLTEDQQAAYAEFLAESRGRESWDRRRAGPSGRPPFPGRPDRRPRPPNR